MHSFISLDLSIHQLAAHGEISKVKTHLASGKQHYVCRWHFYTHRQIITYYLIIYKYYKYKTIVWVFRFRQGPTEQSG